MYPSHFVSKLTDCDGEINETDTSLSFAKDCEYITSEEHAELAAARGSRSNVGSNDSKARSFLLPALNLG